MRDLNYICIQERLQHCLNEQYNISFANKPSAGSVKQFRPHTSYLKNLQKFEINWPSGSQENSENRFNILHDIDAKKYIYETLTEF